MNLGDNHLFDPPGVASVSYNDLVEVPFLLCRLLCENVAVISVSSLHFSSSGKHEALFGTGVGLHFGHCYKKFS